MSFGELWKESFDYAKGFGYRGAELNQIATKAARLSARYGWHFISSVEYVTSH